MKELYNDIFISRQKSLQFVVSERDKQTGSRIGGYAPSYFDKQGQELVVMRQVILTMI